MLYEINYVLALQFDAVGFLVSLCVNIYRLCKQLVKHVRVLGEHVSVTHMSYSFAIYKIKPTKS